MALILFFSGDSYSGNENDEETVDNTNTNVPTSMSGVILSDRVGDAGTSTNN